MAEQQSPSVEVAAPTVIISNSNESDPNGDVSSAISSENSSSGENAGDNSGPGEFSSHNNGDATEDSASPIVAVAQIEAERDVTLAAIHDETERERLRLEAERIEAIEEGNKEYSECQREIQELREQVQKLTDLLIPPQPLEETAVEEQLEIAPETISIQPSTVAPTVETLMEPSEESAEESLEEAAAAPNPARKFIAI
jgi:hypothetical protein